MGLTTQQIKCRSSVISVVSAPNSSSHHFHCSLVVNPSSRHDCLPFLNQSSGFPPLLLIHILIHLYSINWKNRYCANRLP